MRDDITSKLRKASKGSPKVQGNSIFALVGLASAVETYKEGEEKMVAEQYISTRHWLLKVADTVMVVFDGNYKSKHKPFQWCQQVRLKVCRAFGVMWGKNFLFFLVKHFFEVLLTHFWPMFSFYTPWKHQETYGFLVFSGGICEVKTPARNGLTVFEALYSGVRNKPQYLCFLLKFMRDW